MRGRWTGTPFVRGGRVYLTVADGTFGVAGIDGYGWPSSGGSEANAYYDHTYAC